MDCMDLDLKTKSRNKNWYAHVTVTKIKDVSQIRTNLNGKNNYFCYEIVFDINEILRWN